MKSSNFSDFDEALKELNSKLKAANIRASIERKGGSLYVRATLPPPPGSSKILSYQQHLSLDIKATLSGLKRAEAEAKKIGAALDLKEFRWSDYRRDQPKVDRRTVADWVLAYKNDHFDKVELTPTTEESFHNSHLTHLKRLPQDQVLTRDLLEQGVKATIPNSYKRAKTCTAFQRFGKFSGLDVTFIDKDLKGSYSSFKPAPRDLPEDDLIVECFYKILDPSWRWVYGMIAVFGLRPHEIFHLDIQELEKGGFILKVLENTKTGYREVRPLHPEWVDQFGLRHKQLPKVTGKTNKDLGHRVAQALRRYKLPFPAYHLRHCYAVRCVEFDVSVSIAARWMGHSVQIHTKTYHAWLSKAVEERVFNRAIGQANRPQPPMIQVLNQDGVGQPKLAGIAGVNGV